MKYHFLLLSGFSFTTIHIVTGQQGKGEGIYLTPHYLFHPPHRHLDISRAITTESSPLHIASSRTRTRNLSFGFRAQVANHKATRPSKVSLLVLRYNLFGNLTCFLKIKLLLKTETKSMYKSPFFFSYSLVHW